MRLSKGVPFKSPEVKAVYDAYPKRLKQKILDMRALIFHVAQMTPAVGALEETLKWGQPSFLTPSKSGTTIRLDRIRNSEDQFALYFHCQTTLVATFREIYGDTLSYEKNRALHFNVEDALPISAIEDCICMALTYHIK